MSDADRIRQALVIRPGDRVLLTTQRLVTHNEAAEVVAGLEAQFPGAHFVIVGGVADVAVQRPS